ncbi:hypothetical protein QBC40DRAFT_171963 [Triangularia verruculosa]|uniref:DUF726 domain protein n=1 Tax=Triangularia verruculosa TaxID=2587418 RepID=A0AAN7AXU7_9PEZI|nr:hypothetical protein QBC40DRAFT_171963 [Triangularia verruculosa]
MPGVDGPSAGDDQNGPSPTTTTTKNAPPTPASAVEYDDFGLPIRKYVPPVQTNETSEGGDATTSPNGFSKSPQPSLTEEREAGQSRIENGSREKTSATGTTKAKPDHTRNTEESGSDEDFKDAVSQRESVEEKTGPGASSVTVPKESDQSSKIPLTGTPAQAGVAHDSAPAASAAGKDEMAKTKENTVDQAVQETKNQPQGHQRNRSSIAAIPVESTSEFSHQQLTSKQPEKQEDEDDGWQTMPAYAPYDIYDDDNKLIAKEYNEADDDQTYGYGNLGGAGKGYTKVLVDDDAESATSMDEHTQYLFQGRDAAGTSITEDDENQRDAVSQLQATKDLLTEGQRIAYVGLTRLELSAMVKTIEESITVSPKSKKQVALAAESMKMWSQKMMIRLYSHMDISSDEQIMIEQLSAHGVMPQDLTPVLMANARVKNPMAEEKEERTSTGSRPSRASSLATTGSDDTVEPPPPYSSNNESELAAPVQMPSQMSTAQKIDIDIRWTVLCDLFLVLIADSIYDSRARVLLERVAKDLEITWLDICRFEKKVTDALEMQQSAEKENWDESEHMETRRQLALKKRYAMMGLATVGGGLIIGLSAGLMAPVIGAGLAAGFTAIGVGGTGAFLGGVGGAAIITSTAAASGSIVGVRAANRRTGAVKTFEYRPLNNNKRVNLIVTVSGWMTGKVDDVRLPFSTVDPVMGDIYSVLWEPEMLTSMGDTINILATEALTQGLQQVLANTFLTLLMSGLQVPVILTKLSYLIDNPWTVSLDRANAAGLILADSLIDRNLGTRPVTLVGYSLGSRVIFSCLKELCKKGAFGLVQNVYLFGSPVVVNSDEYLRARSVVSGRFISGYNRNDWILGYLFRLTNGGIRRIAGLAPIEGVPGLENMDVSEWVVGHMDYRTAMPRLLRECGWLVESDEFTEIEDPDPDNHQERQRELINEIEEARKELEREGKNEKKSRFSLFSRKQKLQKQEWEVYEDSSKSGVKPSGKTEDKDGNNHGVLFDVDAIRAELAKEAANNKQNDQGVDEGVLQVKEIKSTLPPMKLDPSRTRGHSLREIKSYDVVSSGFGSPNGNRGSDEYRPAASPPAYSNRQASSSFSASGSKDSGYYPAYGGGGGFGDDDDGMQMTFDTGFSDTKPSSTPAAPATSTSASTGRGMDYSGINDPSNNEPPRPELRGSQTLPNIALADPWADYDDDDFGKEKEIEMTFA